MAAGQTVQRTCRANDIVGICLPSRESERQNASTSRDQPDDRPNLGFAGQEHDGDDPSHDHAGQIDADQKFPAI